MKKYVPLFEEFDFGESTHKSSHSTNWKNKIYDFVYNYITMWHRSIDSERIIDISKVMENAVAIIQPGTYDRLKDRYYYNTKIVHKDRHDSVLHTMTVVFYSPL